MIQVFPKATYNANFGATTAWMPVLGGFGDWTTFTFSNTQCRHPMSVTGTFQNLVLRIPTAIATDLTVTLLVDGSNAALTATIVAGQTTSQDITHTVAVTTGTNDVCWKLTGTVGAGHPLNLWVEFESSDTVSSCYASASCFGSISDGAGKQGGALGNGFLAADYTPPPTGPDDSATYSLAGPSGTLTRLDAKTHSGAPGVGVSWKCYLMKNLVLQDGTGGTVNTLAEITGAVATSASKTFALTVTAFDHVEFVVIRSGASASFSVAHVACSVKFEADTAGQYILCGGNNNTISGSVPNYQWMQAEQNGSTEAPSQTPIGTSGCLALAFYVERNEIPNAVNPTAQYTDTLRKNGADTALAITSVNVLTGQTTGSVNFTDGDTIDIAIVPANAPQVSQLHWVLTAQSGFTPTPPAPSGTTYQTRRVRRFQLPYNDNLRMFLRRLEFIVQSGVGLTTGQGSDPVIMLRISRDGGHTFGTERQLSVGALGQYKTRVFGNNFGYYRDGVAEISMTDPVFWALLSCTAKIDEGTS